MKGRINIKWKAAQGMFKAAMPTYKNFGRELWSSKVITAIWSIFWLTWNTRNAHLHTEMAEMHLPILDKQVRKAFSFKHSMFATGELLFHMPLAECLNTLKESKVL
eukprot:4717766-Ditylum_brightwellii.AAC.1